MKRLLMLVAWVGVAQAQTSETPHPELATFTHPHLGAGQVVLTGTLTDPVIENQTGKTIHAVTVQLVTGYAIRQDTKKEVPMGPYVIARGSKTDITPGGSQP